MNQLHEENFNPPSSRFSINEITNHPELIFLQFFRNFISHVKYFHEKFVSWKKRGEKALTFLFERTAIEIICKREKRCP